MRRIRTFFIGFLTEVLGATGFASLFTVAASAFEVAGPVPDPGFDTGAGTDTGTGIDTGAGADPTPFACAVFLAAIFFDATTPAAVPAATAALCAPSAATF